MDCPHCRQCKSAFSGIPQAGQNQRPTREPTATPAGRGIESENCWVRMACRFRLNCICPTTQATCRPSTSCRVRRMDSTFSPPRLNLDLRTNVSQVRIVTCPIIPERWPRRRRLSRASCNTQPVSNVRRELRAIMTGNQPECHPQCDADPHGKHRFHQKVIHRYGQLWAAIHTRL